MTHAVPRISRRATLLAALLLGLCAVATISMASRSMLGRPVVPVDRPG